MNKPLRSVLRQVKPQLVFECWKNEHRAAVMELLFQNGYNLFAPRRALGDPAPVTLMDEPPLSLEESISSEETEFYARPRSG